MAVAEVVMREEKRQPNPREKLNVTVVLHGEFVAIKRSVKSLQRSVHNMEHQVMLRLIYDAINAFNWPDQIR